MKTETIKRLKESVKFAKKHNEDMDDASWGYEKGCLITHNEAQDILKMASRIAELEKEREELDKIRVILTKVKAHNSMMSYEDIDKALTQAIGLLLSQG